MLLASLLLALAGLAGVLATGLESRRDPGGSVAAVRSATNDATRPVASQRTSVVTPPTPAAGPVSRSVERDVGGPVESPITPPDDRDTRSIDTGDWRDRVAAELGREAAEALPLNAGALHTHVADAPVVGSGAEHASGLEGWDGGAFWFGPLGLMRVTPAQP